MKCKCTIAQKLVGDGCSECNPALALDYATSEIAELKERLQLVGNIAKDASTAPTDPALLRRIHTLAYELI